MTKEWKPLFGAKAVADRYCDGNRKRVERLMEKGLLKPTRAGRALIFDPDQIERALKGKDRPQ